MVNFFSLICPFQVTVRCTCQRLKAEWICKDVQLAEAKRGSPPVNQRLPAGTGLLQCDVECARLAEEKLTLERNARLEAEKEAQRIKEEKEKVMVDLALFFSQKTFFEDFFLSIFYFFCFLTFVVSAGVFFLVSL